MKLFSKTCAKDFDWIRLAIKSVSKRCQEEVEWTIAIELQEQPGVLEIIKDYPAIKFNVVIVEHVWPDAMAIGNGYLRQQWIKLNAHKAIQGLFYHWDSDLIAVKHFTQASFAGKSGRPIYWFSAYNDLIVGSQDPNATKAYHGRMAAAKSIFGWPINFEYMRCLPIGMFSEITENGARSEYWPKMHGMLVAGNEFFSEFNFMGEYAHHFFPDAFEWKNAEKHPPTWSGGYVLEGQEIKFQEHAIVSQGFSWGGVPESVKQFVGAM